MSFGAKILRVAVIFYQFGLSWLGAGNCRFTPSCSAYAIEALHRFGAIRGGWLTLRRISRCQPLGSAGYDPVPDDLYTKTSGDG